jgi:uncharacterized membrane protein
MEKITRKLRNDLVAGILLILPLIATVSILWWVFVRIIKPLVGGIMQPFLLFIIPETFHEALGLRTLFVWDIIGIILLFVFVVVIGMLARNFLVKKIVSVYENFLSRIPIINKIYKTVHQISRAFFGVERTGFKRVVLLEYPRKGIWTFGFVSGRVKGELPPLPGEKVLNIFIPTTPNPTSGYLIQVPEKDTIALDIKVAEAFELIISAGAISPDLNDIIKDSEKR